MCLSVAKGMVIKMTIHVQVKSAAKASPQVVSRLLELGNRPKNVTEFLDEVVKTCIKEFEEGRGLFTCLTGQELYGMSLNGKISFDGHESGAMNVSSAITNARQCFEDGIVRVILDGNPLDSLDQEITLTEESTAVFIRLSMLSGRY